MFSQLCASSEPEEISNRRNKEINKFLEECKHRDKFEIKLLLLGTGQSGKSTFIRQMRIIYDNGYNDEEKRAYIKINYTNRYNERNAKFIAKVECEDFMRVTDMYSKAFKDLWYDQGVQECYRRRREYSINDSFKYYMEHIDRIADPYYLPSECDILYMRVPTTGIVEYKFQIGHNTFRMIDVGGQRAERRKWIHCFDQAKVIIFLVAISEYDQNLEEDPNVRRLDESRNVFTTICNYEWFLNTSIVVFFNKIDLLEEKIMYSDLSTYYPAYKGPRHDHEAARKFIHDMFMEQTRRVDIYKHFTCGTDTTNMKVIFSVVQLTVLRRIYGHLCF
ncbi:guanine nucleotide-binding protein G(q) subunit alpha-like [Haematobia irritans]|uniref:guanine nucleotide-binding protein G(q) subunit alpha-like n=1 Tax=Haematobia irritans TaxID=7368 RepID=UPI003F4F69ED